MDLDANASPRLIEMKEKWGYTVSVYPHFLQARLAKKEPK